MTKAQQIVNYYKTKTHRLERIIKFLKSDKIEHGHYEKHQILKTNKCYYKKSNTKIEGFMFDKTYRPEEIKVYLEHYKNKHKHKNQPEEILVM